MSNGVTTAEYVKWQSKKAVEKFYELSAWTDEDYIVYNGLLEALKNSYKKCGKEEENPILAKIKGDALENIVNFIIEKSYFLEVYPNKRNGTNEIDNLIVISDYGEQTFDMHNISKKLLGFDGDYFLGECKNYDDTVGVTWVGKFNTLLSICGDCNFGVIFSYKGLAGAEDKWYSSHGLTKIIFKLSGNKKYILDFNINDFELLKNKKYNLFKILKAKKKSLVTGCKSENLYEPHDGAEEMKEIYNELLDSRYI